MVEIRKEILRYQDLLNQLDVKEAKSVKTRDRRAKLAKRTKKLQNKRKQEIVHLQRKVSDLAANMVGLEEREHQAMLERQATEARRRLNANSYPNDIGGTIPHLVLPLVRANRGKMTCNCTTPYCDLILAMT